MGQEQSQSQSISERTFFPSVNSDISYTLASVDRPQSSSQPVPVNRAKRPETKTLKDIVVVSQSPKDKEPKFYKDNDLKRLNNIPSFSPLFSGSPSSPLVREHEALSPARLLDPCPSIYLSARYQVHLRKCANAVAFDQDMITSRIQEVDDFSLQVLRTTNERYRKMGSIVSQMQKVHEISATLKRIDTNMQKILPLMQRLNSLLPDEEQLEPFVLGTISENKGGQVALKYPK